MKVRDERKHQFQFATANLGAYARIFCGTTIINPTERKAHRSPHQPISSSLFSLSSGYHISQQNSIPVTAAMAGTVVIFDFDKTIIDCDSDNWVLDELGFTDLFESLLPTMPWNSLMDRMMKEVHVNGRSVDDIAEVLKRAPLDPHVISAIKSAYALGCDLRIVSDANLFFIETILKHHGLIGCFAEINTNPSYVDEEGRLRIFPYHDFTKSSHGCLLCPPNMCKGKVVDRICASAHAERKRIIYLGDGKGDYCPSLRLGEGDFVMPRRNYPCWDLITRDPSAIKAEVSDWSYGEEQEQILLRLIERSAVSCDNAVAMSLLSAADCKLESMPGSSHDVLLPKAMPVSQ